MDTLNIKFNKYWYKHTLATLKWRLEWKLRMSKMPWGKIYRHFWRKRLMKRIMEVANEINQHSMRGTHEPISFPPVLDKPNYDLCVPAVGVVSAPLGLPLGWVPQGPEVLNPGIIAPLTGVPVMDPTKIYKITPDITLPEFPVIRRRICHLRKKTPWKFHTKSC